MSEWIPEEQAPIDETVLVYLRDISAVSIANKADRGQWWSNSGSKWPPGIVTHWMPLPPPPTK